LGLAKKEGVACKWPSGTGWPPSANRPPCKPIAHLHKPNIQKGWTLIYMMSLVTMFGLESEDDTDSEEG